MGPGRKQCQTLTQTLVRMVSEDLLVGYYLDQSANLHSICFSVPCSHSIQISIGLIQLNVKRLTIFVSDV